MNLFKTILRSNRKINGAFGGIFDGLSGGLNNLMLPRKVTRTLEDGTSKIERMGVWEGIKDAHKGDPKAWDTVGGYSARKIAGSYIGFSAAGRVATGGGIYKDNNGNTDLIGIPFI